MPLIARYFPPTLYCNYYGSEREFFTLRRFLPCTPSCWFSGFHGANSLTANLAGPQAHHRNIVLAQLLRQMTAIHKRGMLVGFIYVPKTFFEVRVTQPWNLPFNGFEPGEFHSNETCLLLVLNLHS